MAAPFKKKTRQLERGFGDVWIGDTHRGMGMETRERVAVGGVGVVGESTTKRTCIDYVL